MIHSGGVAVPRTLRDRSSEAQTTPTTVVYLAYGPPRFVWVAAFSALTFMRAAKELPDCRVVAYTDRPKVFERLQCASELIPLSELATRVPPYHFRLKVMAMLDAANRYDGNLLFVDGDTYFAAPPAAPLEALANGAALMHTPDCQLGGEQSARVVDLAKLAAAGIGSERLPKLDNWPEWIWNSGVIGISEDLKPLIPDVLAACDEIHAATGSHISEQMAWTLVLSEVGEITSVGDVVYHYWDAKEELMHEVVAFLRRNRKLPPQELAERAYQFRPRATENWRRPSVVRARIAARDCRRFLLRTTGVLAPLRREHSGK